MHLIGKILRFAFLFMSRGPAALQHPNVMRTLAEPLPASPVLIKENANTIFLDIFLSVCL